MAFACQLAAVVVCLALFFSIGMCTSSICQRTQLVVDAEKRFQERYAIQINSMKCYARHHHYGFILLEDKQDYPACASIKSYFFVKHCMFEQEMLKYPNNTVFVRHLSSSAAALRSLDNAILTSLLSPLFFGLHSF